MIDHLCNHQFESKGIIEIKNLENVCNDIDMKSESIVQQYENKIMSSSLSSTNDYNVSNKFIELKVNTEIESQVFIHQFESKYSSEINSCKNIYNENENNPVCPYDEVKITTSLLNTECSNLPNESNNLFTNINDKVSSINNNEKPILLCRTINLKDELLNGIHQYGIQDRSLVL